MICDCQYFQCLKIERSGLEKPLDIAIVLQLLVHCIKVEPGEATVRVLRHSVFYLTHYVLISLRLNARLSSSCLVRN